MVSHHQRLVGRASVPAILVRRTHPTPVLGWFSLATKINRVAQAFQPVRLFPHSLERCATNSFLPVIQGNFILKLTDYSPPSLTKMKATIPHLIAKELSMFWFKHSRIFGTI